jgi:hypothetical protein
LDSVDKAAREGRNDWGGHLRSGYKTKWTIYMESTGQRRKREAHYGRSNATLHIEGVQTGMPGGNSA